jgi:hypothetical protein
MAVFFFFFFFSFANRVSRLAMASKSELVPVSSWWSSIGECFFLVLFIDLSPLQEQQLESQNYGSKHIGVGEKL